jgi:hypothetical protein
MLSYPIKEAEELLASKLAAAKQSLENCEEDLDFLREQITVCLLNCPEALTLVDHGSCDGSSLQLGCHNEAERKE